LTFFFYLPLLLVYALFAIYAERKISAFIQNRLGPMETGPYGLLQTVADFIKLIQKEDIVPSASLPYLFRLAPIFVFAVVFAGFSVLPANANLAGAGVNTGVYLLLALVSLDVIGLMLAGWSSNNKYSTLGTFRAAAQLLSYEIALGISVLIVCVWAGTLNLQEISLLQGIFSNKTTYAFGIANGWDVQHIGGFLSWNVFTLPILFFVWIIFFIASLAESNRAPFDLLEAEAELVGGIQTEYSGFRWAVIMFAEYGIMLLVSLLGAILFFGSWYSPLPNIGELKLANWTNGTPGNISAFLWGSFWLISKAIVLVSLQIWVRWTFPRLRINQLMSLCWKYLVPFALFLLLLTALWKIWVTV
jgi:NADH-quinone oxidoreductase subunit H